VLGLVLSSQRLEKRRQPMENQRYLRAGNISMISNRVTKSL
jgi:hypothetical protein